MNSTKLSQSDSQYENDSEDEPLPNDSSNSIQSDLHRTSNLNGYPFDDDTLDSYQLSEYLNKFYQDFPNQNNIVIPHPYFRLPPFKDNKVKIEIPTNTKIEKVIIHLLDLTSMSNNKKHIIHSWCDLGAMTSVEAKRLVTQFISTGYKELGDPNAWVFKPELSWAKTLNFRMFQKTSQSVSHSIRIFHYIGIGFPSPEKDRIFMKDNVYSHGNYTMLSDIYQALKPPSMLIFDCDEAAVLKPFLMELKEKEDKEEHMFFALFSCSQNEQLRIASNLPKNFFTCTLLSPEKAFSAITGINVEGQKSLFLRFLNIFMDSIAVDMLSSDQFQLLFRSNGTIASIWRRFLLAQRLMMTFGLHCQSIPVIADTSEHQLWVQFEYAMMSIKNGNPLQKFADLYKSYFIEVELPPLHVCSFVISLLDFEELKPSILKILSKFMERSPVNCVLIGRILDYHKLGNFDPTLNSPLLKYWCTVMSGLLLAENFPSKSNTANFSQFQEEMGAAFNDKLPERTRILIFSILVFMNDSQSCLNHYINSEQVIEKNLSALFESSPAVRQWIFLFIQSSISTFPAEPILIGPTAIHGYAMLLMYDSSYITRAAAICLLSYIMAPDWINFNNNVIRIAMKGALDGSYVVRLCFLRCLYRYISLSNYSFDDDDDEPEDTELIVRFDPLAFSNCVVTKPKLKCLIEQLKKDPNTEVAKFAEIVFNHSEEDDYEESPRSTSKRIHKIAHASLFSKSLLNKEINSRYKDTIIMVNNLELLEIIESKKGKIVSLSFDSNSCTVIYATETGDICYGSNHWKVTCSILQVCNLPYNGLAVSQSDGAIHIYRNGFETEIDSFLPSILHYSNKIVMGNNATLFYISQDQNKIFLWDLISLLLIEIIEVECPVQSITCINKNFVYFALTNGKILLAENNKIVKSSERFINQTIIKMGRYNNFLWTYTSNGEINLWENFDCPKCIANDMFNYPGNKISISPYLPLIISINDTVTLKNFSTGHSYEMKCEKANPVCCCMDDDKPIAAIGYEDGSVSIWRLPL